MDLKFKQSLSFGYFADLAQAKGTSGNWRARCKREQSSGFTCISLAQNERQALERARRLTENLKACDFSQLWEGVFPHAVTDVFVLTRKLSQKSVGVLYLGNLS